MEAVHELERHASRLMLAKIVTGGQTGVDRGALDAALDAGFPCGGWCPSDRTAEDGPIPERYPVRPLPAGGYRERTIRNVVDSDATLIIYFDLLEGGTEQTMLHCVRRKRPYKLIDASAIPALAAGQLAARFVAANNVATLNVAGPRGSRASGAHRYAYEATLELLRSTRLER